MTTISISAVIVTLNEEKNIVDCIQSIREAGVDDILVVDASSTDGTVELARSLGASTYSVPRNGLGFQRQFGVDKVNTEFVLLVDADNRFNPDCVMILYKYLSESYYAAVAPIKVGIDSKSYWVRAWTWHNSTSLYKIGEKQVIGTPALFRTKILKSVRYDVMIKGSSDDTDLCYRLAKAGYKVAASPGVCYEVMRETFLEFYNKVIWYGRGDAEFFLKHPERRLSIASHPIRNYFLKGQLKAVKAGRFDLLPFFALYGLIRTTGFIIGIASYSFGFGAKIYRT